MATEQEWETRLAAITDLRAVMSHLNIDEPNMDIYTQGLIQADDVATLASLEAAWVTVSQQIAQEQSKESRLIAGKAARDICSNTLDLIAGWNLSRGLSAIQIDQMVTDYSDVLTALQNNRPDTAKSLLEAKTPDGTLVTQEMYDEILEAL